MKFIVLLITLLAWAGQFLTTNKTARLLQFLIFLPVGLLLALFGGFSYWWDKSMQPDVASPFMLICGILILIAQLASLLRSIGED